MEQHARQPPVDAPEPRDEAPGPPEGLEPQLEFLRDIWALNHALEVASRRSRGQRGLTGPQLTILRLVGLFPNAGPSRIARLMHVHAGTVSPMVGALVTQGYLARSADPGDARRSRLRLTPQGKRATQERGDTPESRLDQALGRLDPTRLAQAREVLARVARALAREGRTSR